MTNSLFEGQSCLLIESNRTRRRRKTNIKRMTCLFLNTVVILPIISLFHFLSKFTERKDIEREKEKSRRVARAREGENILNLCLIFPSIRYDMKHFPIVIHRINNDQRNNLFEQNSTLSIRHSLSQYLCIDTFNRWYSRKSPDNYCSITTASSSICYRTVFDDC